jgi:hypothetical protein
MITANPTIPLNKLAAHLLAKRDAIGLQLLSEAADELKALSEEMLETIHEIKDTLVY